MKTIIGIDNGLDGGIAAVSESGLFLEGLKMPTVWRSIPARKNAKAKRMREVDSMALLETLDRLVYDRSRCLVVFEECPHHSRNKGAMRGMGINAGKVLALLESRGFEHRRILSLDWQPKVLGKVPKGKAKEVALAKAQALWPGDEWTHDGIIDAALIAEFGRRKLLS